MNMHKILIQQKCVDKMKDGEMILINLIQSLFYVSMINCRSDNGEDCEKIKRFYLILPK